MSVEEDSGQAESGVRDGVSGLKKVLFLTSSEYGQANVILAVAYELLLRRKYEVHIMSFELLKKRVKEISDLAAVEKQHAATFHTVPGLSYIQAIDRNTQSFGPYPPGVKGALKTYKITLPIMATAWDGPEYMTGYSACLETLRTMVPDIIVVDPFFDQGLQACKTASRDYVVLSPNTFQEILKKQQPFLHRLCTYPAISSGFAYPVPWSQVPANIYLKISMLFILLRSPKMKTLMNLRKSQNLPAIPPNFDLWQPQNHYLVPSIPETDFPCKITSNVTPCGPLLLPVSPVSEIDPALGAWLERGPTVLINLGSHIRMDNIMVREFAVGLKVLLDRRPKIQVLWKLKTSGGLALPPTKSDPRSHKLAKLEEDDDALGKGSLDAITNEIVGGRVKIMEWMSVDPLAVLQTGHIVCSVHHGGSNSFHEALSVGVPHIVLPCWLDTLEFANRVEWLGIGVYGSRTAAPRVDAWELSRALMRVLGDSKEALKMNKKANELAAICSKVGGRAKACEKIINLLERS
ncbi:UDP-glucoronosyl and UDP-glucosyl transferase family protein [Amylocarpus encephaloides]|uniref:UDP-glucoronosyl and UDP-glucosyl transferase family protein n=1 Tax=Amylocarpus encephaloides TaxID=45428 RepID=A0A9P8C426_9HELO|nr:UDP-glucoronosyl and UDP-glucosyl transferase family protein [Amylocarpus encephaloides]